MGSEWVLEGLFFSSSKLGPPRVESSSKQASDQSRSLTQNLIGKIVTVTIFWR